MLYLCSKIIAPRDKIQVNMIFSARLALFLNKISCTSG